MSQKGRLFFPTSKPYCMACYSPIGDDERLRFYGGIIVHEDCWKKR